MKYSIVVPVYNAGNKIIECVDSVLKQNIGSDYELILVDDKSTDNSLNVCQNLSSNNDQIVVIASRQNEGPGAARNKGLLAAKGEYVLFLDSDDKLEDNALQILENNYNSTKNYDVVIFGYIVCNGNFNRIGKVSSTSREISNEKEIADLLIKWGNSPYLGAPWNKLYKREYLINNNILFPEKRQIWAEDYSFNLDVLLNHPNIYILEETLYLYLLSNTGLTHFGKHHSTDMIVRKNQVISVLKKYLLLTKLSDNSERLYWGCYYILYLIRLGSYNYTFKELSGYIKEELINVPEFEYISTNYKKNRLNISQRIRMALLNRNYYNILAFEEIARTRFIKFIERIIKR